MLALNSPSVSPTMLITIPFGQAKKTASAALVLIKKSECSTVAAMFMPGRGSASILLWRKKTPPRCSFLMGVNDAMPSLHPPSTVSSPLPLQMHQPPPTSNGWGQCGSARNLEQGNSPVSFSRGELAGQTQGHVHFYLHLLPPSSCTTINKLMENKLGAGRLAHAIIPFLKPTTALT